MSPPSSSGSCQPVCDLMFPHLLFSWSLSPSLLKGTELEWAEQGAPHSLQGHPSSSLGPDPQPQHLLPLQGASGLSAQPSQPVPCVLTLHTLGCVCGQRPRGKAQVAQALCVLGGEFQCPPPPRTQLTPASTACCCGWALSWPPCGPKGHGNAGVNDPWWQPSPSD